MSATDSRRVPTWLWGALIAAAIVLLLAELFVHHHAAFGIDGAFGFYAWYTLVVGIVGVAAARVLALLLGYGGGEDV